MTVVIKMVAAFLLTFAQQVAANCEQDRLASLGRDSVVYDKIGDVPASAWNSPKVVIVVNNMPRPSQAWAEATATEIVTSPLLEGKLGYQFEALLMLTWAEKETNYSDNAIGDGGSSHCSMQIYLPDDGKTAEGWTGEQLRKDPAKCIKAARRLMKKSFVDDPDHPMGTYAGDKKLSDKRIQLVKREVAEFPALDLLGDWLWVSELVGRVQIYDVPTTD